MSKVIRLNYGESRFMDGITLLRGAYGSQVPMGMVGVM